MRSNHQPRLSALALASVAALCGGPAWAQDKPATSDNTEQIVVTGVRRAVESAQTIKRESDQVLDTIVADDIGKFPDKNVAEVLGRVTGVQIIRDSGEAGNVIVRGLGGVVTLLNGREIFTAAGRSLYLADVPTTMLNRIDVYKSQGPELVEGGTAGVIDVRTNRPFQFKGREISLALKEEYRDKAKSLNPDISGMFSDRWSTPLGEMGFLIGASHSRGTYQDETAWVSPPFQISRGIHTVDGQTGGTGNVTGFDAMGRVLVYGERERDALNFSAQWRPRTDLELYAEGFRTEIRHDAESDFFVGVVPHWIPGGTITTSDGTHVDSFSHPSGDPFTLSSTQARRDYSRGEQYALGGKWDATDDLRITSEYVHTNSNYKRSNPILDLTWDGVKAVDARVVNGGGYLTYPDGGVTDPNNFRIFQFFDLHNHSESDADDFRADASYSFDDSLLKELGAGVRVARRSAQYVNEKNGFTSTPVDLRVPVSSIPGLACLSHRTGGDYGFKQFVTPCRDYMLDNLSGLREAATGSSAASPDDPLSYYRDVERTNALYLKARFGTTLGGVGLDATTGVRLVQTKQTISGYGSVNGVPTDEPFTTDGSSNNALPSLSLKASWTPTLISRLVYGKAIQRPNFADYNPGLRLFPSNGNTTLSVGNAGNPDLKPIKSENIDATLEWYFSKTGSLTGTAFRHEFKDFLVYKAAPETYDGIEYQVTRPYNAQGGHLEGFEVGYRQFFDQLPGLFSGLGVEANYTYMKGGLTDPSSGITTNFPGMSKESYNLVGLYEKGPWYARLAYNWRSKFIAEYNYRALGIDLVVDPMQWLDASIGYRFNNNLTIGLEGSNLLDQDYHDYHGTPNQPRDVRRYDSTVALSLRWKL